MLGQSSSANPNRVRARFLKPDGALAGDREEKERCDKPRSCGRSTTLWKVEVRSDLGQRIGIATPKDSAH